MLREGQYDALEHHMMRYGQAKKIKRALINLNAPFLFFFVWVKFYIIAFKN